MVTDNYLIPGNLFVAHAQAEIDELKNTAFTSADIAGLEEDNQPAPGLHAVPDPDNPEESVANEGAKQVISRLWHLVLVTKNARDTRRGKDVRNDTGMLLPKIRRAFNGWTPPEQGDMVFQPVVRIQSPARPWHSGDAAFYHFPLLYETSFVFH
ncbi:MAG: hypothetical protein GY862_18870 [Gammaproteobacteria bacterium]|nr:hypothetical protein [Gammaproteobacteria bacterium]